MSYCGVFTYKLQPSVRGFFGEEACKSEVYGNVRAKQLSLQVMPISQPEHAQW